MIPAAQLPPPALLPCSCRSRAPTLSHVRQGCLERSLHATHVGGDPMIQTNRGPCGRDTTVRCCTSNATDVHGDSTRAWIVMHTDMGGAHDLYRRCDQCSILLPMMSMRDGPLPYDVYTMAYTYDVYMMAYTHDVYMMGQDAGHMSCTLSLQHLPCTLSLQHLPCTLSLQHLPCTLSLQHIPATCPCCIHINSIHSYNSPVHVHV
jgi:hypothetical protein